MTWSAPRTWATSEVVTAANMNTYLSNNLAFLGATAASSISTSSATNDTTYNTFTGNPAVTLTTLTTALVIIGASMSTGSSTGAAPYMSFAVSGATTIAANDASSINIQNSAGVSYAAEFSGVFYLHNLTGGSNTITASYRSRTGSGPGQVATFANRHVAVIPLTT